jgi:hypothetical protein
VVKRKRQKSRSKGVTLSSEFWFRNSREISEFREFMYQQQGMYCAVSEEPTANPVLDHNHLDGKVRGVLDSQVNMIEGRYLSLYNKSKVGTKFNLTFSEFLIRLGNYLQKDITETRLHPKHMEDFRKKVKRWRKEELLTRLKEDYNITPEPKTLVSDLVQLYVQAWVNNIENTLDK